MSLDARLFEILVCPQCKGALAQVDGGQALLCDRCKLRYPVKDGIPVMVAAEAQSLRAVQSSASVKLPRVSFRVIEGKDAGLTFHLEQGSCRALGRAAGDPNRTAVFTVEVALALDEGTRGLILRYVAKQFQKASAAEAAPPGERLGSFRRAPDVVLSDGSLSRLHAMVFSDGERVAVLDLVSKNGTYVNGQEVESRMLSRGDVIEVGDTTIVVEG
jgi:uncharacterized protein YbaR (Trm112 family)